MFRSFIYLDQDALSRYASHLGLSPNLRVKELDGSVGASLGRVNANVSVSAENSSSDSEPARAYEAFERKLADCARGDYFDFLDSSGYDASTLPSMCLFRFAGVAMVPEGFDLLDAMRKLMPLFSKTGMIDLNRADASTEFAVQMLTQNQGAIPVVIDGLEIPVVSKLKTEWLEGGDPMVLEDIQDDDAIFLCKVVAHAKGEKVPIFDPLRDFMKVNRALRRTMKRSEGLEIVYEEGPVIRAEVVAIYH